MIFATAVVFFFLGLAHVAAMNTPTRSPTETPTKTPTNSPDAAPTSMPSYVTSENQDTFVFQKKRARSGGYCENACSNNGSCKKNSNCDCHEMNGQKMFTGADCSLKTCPKGSAWVGDLILNNDLHGSVECSNKGKCNRKTGECECYDGYEGRSCSRTACPDDCNGRGKCVTQKTHAKNAGRVYESSWDSLKQVGCKCDPGYRGFNCGDIECPTNADPLQGAGSESGRDCSGRGECNYQTGECKCFPSFGGSDCSIHEVNF